MMVDMFAVLCVGVYFVVAMAFIAKYIWKV